jgi:Fur family iron response transcriptional regulator
MVTRMPVPMDRAKIAGMLRASGIAPTHQRVEIAGVMFARCEHFSADQLLAQVNASFSEVSKATVYNTLRLFLEKKLIREVIVDPTRVFYEPITTPHHHFYNLASGELSDILGADLQISGLPALPEGMETESIDVIVRIRPRGLEPDL